MQACQTIESTRAGIPAIDTSDTSRKEKSGVGATERTSMYTGVSAALGAGARAGVLTQVFTQGGAIKTWVESALTFKFAKPLGMTTAK